MNILDTPFIVEFFFILSTLVFVATLYAILPALIYDKRTLSKPSIINRLWRKLMRTDDIIVSKKKELMRILLVSNKN